MKLITILLNVLYVPTILLADVGQMMGGRGDHSMGWFGGAGVFFMLFFWGIFILGLLALLKWIFIQFQVNSHLSNKNQHESK